MVIFTLIGVGFGLALFVGAALAYRSGKRQGRAVDELLRTGTHTRGPVVGYETRRLASRGDIPSTLYLPVVRFNTPQGVIETAARNGADFPIAEIGEDRAICYNPDEPTIVVVTDTKLGAAKNPSRMTMAIGGFLAVAGTLVLAFTAVLTYTFF